MAIGMGKHKGRLVVHKQTVHHAFREIIPESGGLILEKLPLLFGVGIGKRKFMDLGHGKSFKLTRRIKELIDSKGLMNSEGTPSGKTMDGCGVDPGRFGVDCGLIV
jgi:hypothetical protein